MPELSRFYGIIIRMYFEVGGQHHRPHFHAYYGDDVAIYSLAPIDSWPEVCRVVRRDSWKRGRNFTKANC